MDYNESAFPVQTAQKDETTGNTFTSTLVGGFSRLEYLTLEIFNGLMANPVYISSKMTSKQLMDVAFQLAADMELRFVAARES